MATRSFHTWNLSLIDDDHGSSMIMGCFTLKLVYNHKRHPISTLKLHLIDVHSKFERYKHARKENLTLNILYIFILKHMSIILYFKYYKDSKEPKFKQFLCYKNLKSCSSMFDMFWFLMIKDICDISSLVMKWVGNWWKWSSK